MVVPLGESARSDNGDPSPVPVRHPLGSWLQPGLRFMVLSECGMEDLEESNDSFLTS